MKCKILHEAAGRMRLHVEQHRMTADQADVLEAYLRSLDGISEALVYERTADVIIGYTMDRAALIRCLSQFSYDMRETEMLDVEHSSRAISRRYEEEIVDTVLRHYFKRMFLPMPIRHAITIVKSVKYIWLGLKCLARGRIEVPVLDATAIAMSILTGDFATAGSVMFLLRIGEILEEWTHKKSVDNLARTMSLNIEKVWTVTDDGQEILADIRSINQGDRIIVRMGNVIPLDGKVISGEAAVNQASMTGESVPVIKRTGAYVYGGTVVEEGECLIEVDCEAGAGRYDRIVNMIEDSERLKSEREGRAIHIADRLVPYTLGASGLLYMLTKNVTRAMAVLMVDFSCALKLAMPLAVLSAMRECSEHKITVKGGKFLEQIAKADTIVFDKTGTLTYSEPRVACVRSFCGKSEDEILRIAACLEEHFPHSMANAVVNAARDRNLQHEEMHTSVEYVVAHGIASSIQDERVVIGSYHFVFEDEATRIDESQQAAFDELPEEYSQLYLAIGGKLAGVICIEDPLREDAAETMKRLHDCGFKNLIMMTGDSSRTAAVIAKEVGVDSYYAEVLPEDKAEFIKEEHSLGRTVIMIGDGINDSPALSEADCGIAISSGAAIAREVADVTIQADSLGELVALKRLADKLEDRIDGNYRVIVSFNGMLILLGALGIMPPTTSALLHNVSTIAIGLNSMTRLDKKE